MENIHQSKVLKKNLVKKVLQANKNRIIYQVVLTPVI